MGLYLVIASRLRLYDASDSVTDSLVEKGETGFVSLDYKMRYLGSNDTAKRMFEEINHYVVDKEINGERSYDIFSRLLKERIILLSGEINDSAANSVIAQLLYLDSISNKDINIYINSPGGSVTAGMAIYDTMNFVKSDVSTTCVGMAASMGAFLLSSGQKGKRYALPNSEVMIHQPLGGVEGQATEIKIVAEHILKIKNKLNLILSKNTGKEIKKIESDTDRDYFLDAIEAQKYGLVDKIIKKRINV